MNNKIQWLVIVLILALTSPAIAKNLDGRGDYWAFVVGIDKYENLPRRQQLNAARHDAETVVEILVDRYEFADNRVVELYDKKATRANIIRELRKLAKKIRKEDNLLIYYSGHGIYDHDLQMGDWVPYDADMDEPASMVSNSEIRAYLKAIKAKHVLTVADSCFSEALLGKTRSIDLKKKEMTLDALDNLYAARSRWVVTSGGLFPVPDADPKKNHHSTFAYYLTKMLEENDQKYLAVGQLVPALAKKVEIDNGQKPQGVPVMGIGDEGGQFVFTLKEKEISSKKHLSRAELEEVLNKKNKALKKEKKPVFLPPTF